MLLHRSEIVRCVVHRFDCESVTIDTDERRRFVSTAAARALTPRR